MSRLLSGLVPEDRLDAVSLGVVSEDQLHHVALTESVAFHDRIYDPATLAGNASAYPVCSFFFSHNSNVHHTNCLLQYMCNNIGVWLRFVQQLGIIPVTILGTDREFVAGLSAQDGLPLLGQRPATQEPATSWVVAFLRCVR